MFHLISKNWINEFNLIFTDPRFINFDFVAVRKIEVVKVFPGS